MKHVKMNNFLSTKTEDQDLKVLVLRIHTNSIISTTQVILKRRNN